MAPPRKKAKKRKGKDKGGQNTGLEDVSDAPLELETQAVSDFLAQSSVRLHIAGLAPSTNLESRPSCHFTTTITTICHHTPVMLSESCR